MRTYLLLITATLTLATYEAAHACGNHAKTKSQLQAAYGGNRYARGGVETKNRQGSGSALDAKFFDKLDFNGSAGAAFNSGFGTEAAKPQ